jgi:hypothetical protein
VTKPITPDEVFAAKEKLLPPEVFEAFNEMIARKWDGDSASFTLKEVATSIANRLKISTADVYARNLLDVEDVYRMAGWGVDFDRPGYNETYEANFAFKKKRK